MDQLWSPWRYQYIKERGFRQQGCVFCLKAEPGSDESNYVFYRGRWNYILVNLFPYTSGHVIIVPYEHVDSLAAAQPDTAAEMMALAQRTETVLRAVYQPGGINLGMNLGECAGAGVAGHIHLHVLPRWVGDANFITVIGETRVQVEEPRVTWEKLRDAFAG
jgi:ATP adenylyltransferase